jgi:hypothetical protein
MNRKSSMALNQEGGAGVKKKNYLIDFSLKEKKTGGARKKNTRSI